MTRGRKQCNEFFKDYGVLQSQPLLAGTRTWDGADVSAQAGTIVELFSKIPTFSRHPFRSGGTENRFKDEIRRDPLSIGDDAVPVATVSKTYSLVQHKDVLAATFKALKLIDVDISKVNSLLVPSEYGERMRWSCAIPNFDYDPGDGCPIVLTINCLNSVDSSTSLEVSLGWHRLVCSSLVCSNGMMFGISVGRLRNDTPFHSVQHI